MAHTAAFSEDRVPPTSVTGLAPALHCRSRVTPSWPVWSIWPVIPRTFPPAPGRSPDGHHITSEVEYGRGPEKTCVCGVLRVWDGHEVTVTASSRNSAFYQQFLQKLETAHPAGDIYVVTGNPSSHNSLSTRTWLEDHPRSRHVFIPVGACWLNLQEGRWRIFRRAALAGRSFAGPSEIEQAAHLAASQLNARARSWIWGRPAPPTRQPRRRPAGRY
ncbi:transposase [Streptomyces sp. NPDC096311]|uniref:transposase n=1 Tax=Streptomyces sp. NPDC096311 TaxID=3366083 RepID=UPI0038231A22